MNRFLGIELGSTRIKAVLIDENAAILAKGSYEWENTLVDGYWSYSLAEVETGLQTSYSELASDYRANYGEELTEVSAMGVSAMMHGHLAFDKDDHLLVPLRTWRNTNANEAAQELTELFRFKIPMRWSVAQYYQAVLDGEAHVKQIAHLTTLAGYVHERLTGVRAIGVGDASGIFPITDGNYDTQMLAAFHTRLKEKGIDTPYETLLPRVLLAGEQAGTLTREGASWLDPTGTLRAGCPLCPPEGDAGTSLVATNTVSPKTASVSAGTSAFLMAVLEKPLNGYYKEIDVLTTPNGRPIAEVQVNNFASEITAWVNLFEELLTLFGTRTDRGELFDILYAQSLAADTACGGLVGYNFLAGEPLADVERGIPLIARTPDGRLTLANFMKMQIYSALGSLSIGCEILKREHVQIDDVYGQGGFFKSPMVGQSAMSAAVGSPITVMQTAGEGGAWGIAVLALFMQSGADDLERFLNDLFRDVRKSTVSASEQEIEAFSAFMKQYKKGLAVEKLASEIL